MSRTGIHEKRGKKTAIAPTSRYHEEVPNKDERLMPARVIGVWTR